MANAGMIVRVAKALAPGLDAKAVAGELRERVLEELDYEYEAQNQRAFARAYDGHPFIYVPKVHSRLSRRRVLVSEYVDGHDFEHVKTPAPGRARHLRRDRLPLLLRLDLPPAALQRRHPPRQLPADGRRAGRLPRLRDDQAPRARADHARAARRRRRLARRSGRAAGGARRDRVPARRRRDRRRAADGARQVRRRLVPRGRGARDHPEAGDEDDRGHLGPALGLLRHGPQGGRARRRADGTANGDRAAGGAGPAAGEGELAPDHARVGLRRPALDGARARRSGATSRGGGRPRRRDCRAGSRASPRPPRASWRASCPPWPRPSRPSSPASRRASPPSSRGPRSRRPRRRRSSRPSSNSRGSLEQTPCTPIRRSSTMRSSSSTVQAISSTPASSAASTSFGVTIWW